MVTRHSHPLLDTGVMKPPSLPAHTGARPTLGHKRDSSYLDTDDESALSSTTKRLKVAFDPNVDVRIMDDAWGNKSMDLVREEVRIAIDRHLAPSESRADSEYLKLVQLLKHDVFDSEAVSSKLLAKYLVAFEGKISSLGDCGQLVMAVLDLTWLGRDEVFVAAYVKLLISIASLQVKYLQPMLERLVANFAYLPSTLGRLPSEEMVSRSVMFARLHVAIKAIINNVPAASTSLLKAVRSEYPNELASARSYNLYQRHLLKLAECAEEIKPEVMAILVQRLVALDVQIQQDIEDLEDETEAEDRLVQQRKLTADDEDEESDNDSVSSSEESRTEEEERLRELRVKVQKMDSSMDLLFSHYQPLVHAQGDSDTDEVFLQLLSHFHTYILPNRTRHAQFLLFHFSQLSPDHATTFAQQCIETGYNNLSNMAQRCSAIAYLSSYVARGSHLSRAIVQQVFRILLDYLEPFRRKHEKSCQGPDRRAYMLYYATAQALLYIFCFRWRDLVLGPPDQTDEDYLSLEEEEEDCTTELDADDLLAEHGELKWLPKMKELLTKNIFSRLNPLRVCTPAIVTEFADISRHVRFIEVISKLESNKRLRLGQTFAYYGASGSDIGRRETAWDRKKGDAHHQMEPYFPFDPYTLPISKRWLEGDYNEWKSPRGMRRDEEDDEDAFYGSESESDDDSLVDHIDHETLLESGSTDSGDILRIL